MTALYKRPHVPAGLAILGLGCLWGAAFPAIETLVREIPPLSAAGIRFVLSGIMILMYAHRRTDQLLPKTTREFLGLSLVGGFMFGGYQAGLYLGTQYVSGAVASVVTTMSPVLAALIAVPVLGESRGWIDVTGFIIGLAGVVILADPGNGIESLSTTAIGVGLVFTGTGLFAMGSVLLQLFDRDSPIEIFQGWAMIVGSVVLFSGAGIQGETIPPAESISPVAMFSLVYLTLVAGAGGYLIFFRLVRRVGATETTLVAYLEPVTATIVSIILLDQTIGLTTIGGFLAVATGFTLVSRRTLRRTIIEFRSTAPTSTSSTQK